MFRHPQATPSRGGMAMNQSVEFNLKPPKAPERPANPYVRFNRKIWSKVQQENPKAQVWEIGKIVSQLWRDLSNLEKQEFTLEYEREKLEYDRAMKEYHQSPAFQQYLAAKNRAKAAMDKGGMPMSGGNGRRSEGVVIQPVDEDEGIEYSAKRIAAARFERNHRLIADLFNPTVVADSRNVVMQSRMETLCKQRNSLKLHQEKLEEDLGRLDNVFNEKKRQLEKNSEEFAVNLKKVCDDKPQLDMEKFNKMVEDWTGTLLKKYQEYQKTQEELMQKQEAEKKETPVLFSLVGGLDSTPPPSAAAPAEGSHAVEEHSQPAPAEETASAEEEPEKMEVEPSVLEDAAVPKEAAAPAAEASEATTEAEPTKEETKSQEAESSTEKAESEEAAKSEESSQSAPAEAESEETATADEEKKPEESAASNDA